MKLFYLLATLTIVAILLSACGGGVTSFTCTDPLGCVTIGMNEPIKIATLLTMTGADQVYGIDAVRGVEIAISDAGKPLGHSIELVKVDDQCDAKAGADAAQKLAQDPQLIGVIGATCSDATLSAAKILSDAHMVLITPSSTSPFLTDPSQHQPGFFRAIYNDQAQAKAVADFTYNVLGLRRMVTIHDGTPYPKELQQAACENFEQLGGDCVSQIDLSSGVDINTALKDAAGLNPDVIYFPLYTANGVTAIRAIFANGLGDAALISSDGLLSTDFIQKTSPDSNGMYLSGPAAMAESTSFSQKYKSRYGQAPIAAYHLQAYDAANMLFYAMQQAGLVIGDKLYIQRQKLRDALYKMRGIKGLSTVISCSDNGDCAQPDIEIFQVTNNSFKAIYP